MPAFPRRPQIRINRRVVIASGATFAVLLAAGATCTPESFLAAAGGGDAAEQSSQADETQDPRVLSPEELDVLLANANSGRVTVVFVSPHSGDPNDFSSMTGIPGPEGPAGPQGPVGPEGPAGPGAFIGEIRMYAGDPATPPPGWLTCDGREVDRAIFPKLFATLGTRFGPGNGLSTFALPDYRNRSPMGANVAGPLGRPMTTVEGVPHFDGGSATHALTPAQMPNHTHAMVHTHELAGTDSGTSGTSMVQLVDPVSASTVVSTSLQAPIMTTAAGAGLPHPILDPYFAVTFVIYTGE